MIAAICAVRNEAQIIDTTLRHTLAEGIDKIFVSVGSSTDGTAGIVESLAKETGQLEVRHDPDPIFHQANVMNELARLAGADGADYLVPFDADEFVYALDGRPVADVLRECPHDKLYLRAWVHHDWNTRVVVSKFWHKVCYRPLPGALLTMGQHDVSIQGGVGDVLAIREWQYRDFDAFVAKRDLWLGALSDADRARGDVAHYQRLRDFQDEELRREWTTMQSVETIADPIPSRVRHG
jgi:glycosyltransferase involved in cell wall biosynthesis